MVKDSPFLESRRERMAKIRLIIERVAPIDFSKMLGMIEVQFGLKMSTAAGYVNALVRAGFVEKDEHGVLSIPATKKGDDVNAT